MSFLYPKCPKCGSPSDTAEGDGVDYANRHIGNYLRHEAILGHPHPMLKSLSLAIAIGRQIYKRLPGEFGGRKRCTNPACGHEFH